MCINTPTQDMLIQNLQAAFQRGCVIDGAEKFNSSQEHLMFKQRGEDARAQNLPIGVSTALVSSQPWTYITDVPKVSLSMDDCGLCRAINVAALIF